jgi:ATP synthase protein I
MAQPASSHVSQNDPLKKKEDWDEEEDIYADLVPLNREQAVALLGESALRGVDVSPWRIVVVQWCVAVLAGFFAFCLSWFEHKAVNADWIVSALIGGILVALPSSVFALRLRVSVTRQSVSALVVGELMKIMLTLLLFLGVAYGYAQIFWPALLISFLITLKAHWAVVLVRKF